MGSALLELGDRYWALGLPAAARSAFTRVLASSSDVAPALRLADIALAQGDATGARAYATEASKRAPSPSTWIALGRAQFAAGEIGAARRSFALVLDAPRCDPWNRARTHRELSRAAAAQGDTTGAAAQAAAAFEAAVAALATPPLDYSLLEDIATAVVAHGRGDEAREALAAVRGRPGVSACAAALLAALQTAGDPSVTDAMIDSEFADRKSVV